MARKLKYNERLIILPRSHYSFKRPSSLSLSYSYLFLKFIIRVKYLIDF